MKLREPELKRHAKAPKTAVKPQRFFHWSSYFQICQVINNSPLIPNYELNVKGDSDEA